MSSTEQMRKIMESLNPSHASMNEGPGDNSEMLEDFMATMEQMEELLSQAESLIRQTGDHMLIARSESYWIPHIRAALTGQPNSMYSMRDAAGDFEAWAYGENGDDEDDGSLDYAARQNGMR